MTTGAQKIVLCLACDAAVHNSYNRRLLANSKENLIAKCSGFRAELEIVVLQLQETIFDETIKFFPQAIALIIWIKML